MKTKIIFFFQEWNEKALEDKKRYVAEITEWRAKVANLDDATQCLDIDATEKATKKLSRRDKKKSEWRAKVEKAAKRAEMLSFGTGDGFKTTEFIDLDSDSDSDEEGKAGKGSQKSQSSNEEVIAVSGSESSSAVSSIKYVSDHGSPGSSPGGSPAGSPAGSPDTSEHINMSVLNSFFQK